MSAQHHKPLQGTLGHLPPHFFLHVSHEELLVKPSQALSTPSHPSPSSPLSQTAPISGRTARRWVPTWGHQGEMRCGQNHGVPPPRGRVSTPFFLAQGLAVEQMATYEDITPFRDVKAKWTVGEHPGEE